MGKKPEGDLGSMTISKAKAAETVPFAAAARPAGAIASSPKSLTVKLDGERGTGTKLTHQEVMVEALRALLGKFPLK
jgi:hypothetical protein